MRRLRVYALCTDPGCRWRTKSSPWHVPHWWQHLQMYRHTQREHQQWWQE